MQSRNKPTAYVEFVIERLEPLGNITARPMFGGFTIYCDDIPFGLVARDALYLKADEQNRPEFEGRGLPAFRPFEDQNSVMQYYASPAEMFEDSDALKHWAGGAIEAGRRARAKKRTRRRRQ